jgi:SAM-dependent methyltransferase
MIGTRPEPGGEREDPEVSRIEAAYRLRDQASRATPYTFANPGYVFFLQLLEWSLLEALRRSPVDIDRARVLDVGCGTGYFVHRLFEFGAREATGIDLMADRVAVASDRYPDARFVCGNAAKMPFEDERFELVTQFTCLSSVLDPELREAIAADMWRVLRPGGVIVSYDMRPESWLLGVKRWAAARRRAPRPDAQATPTTPITEAELHRLFPAATVGYSSTGLDFDLCAISAWSPVLARALACIPPLRAHGMGVLIKQDRD